MRNNAEKDYQDYQDNKLSSLKLSDKLKGNEEYKNEFKSVIASSVNLADEQKENYANSKLEEIYSNAEKELKNINNAIDTIDEHPKETKYEVFERDITDYLRTPPQNQASIQNIEKMLSHMENQQSFSAFSSQYFSKNKNNNFIPNNIKTSDSFKKALIKKVLMQAKIEKPVKAKEFRQKQFKEIHVEKKEELDEKKRKARKNTQSIKM